MTDTTVGSGGDDFWVDPITVVRSYVYTYVSEFGEEGPPSAPTVKTGNVGETWSLLIPDPTSSQLNGRSITTKRVYRTVTSVLGIATYFRVDEIAVGVTSYSDNKTDDDITGNEQLQSTGWIPPDSSLKGWVAMPNGIIAAWKDNEVWFCEPYRPHAWPAEYAVAVDYPVVGCGVMGQTLIICTTGSPWTATGVHPSVMSLAKINSYEPCTSRASIISTPNGVIYSSPNGLVVATPGQVTNLTQGLIGPAEWKSRSNIYKLRAVQFNTAYMAYETPGITETNGIMIDPSASNSRLGYIQLKDTSYAISNIIADPWSALPLIIKGGQVFVLDNPDSTNLQPYKWRSKIFKMNKKENLGAAKIYFTVPPGAPTLIDRVVNPTTLTASMYGIFRVYCDGVLRFSRELRTSGEEFRLPSGFMAEEWQFEIEARVIVTDIQIASTSRELGRG
jgi:hypothetical protein